MKLTAQFLLAMLLFSGCTTPELSSKGPDALAAAIEHEINTGQFMLAERRVDEMVRIGDTENDPKIIGDAVFLRAKIVRIGYHEFDRALELLDLAEESYEKANYTIGLAVVFAERGKLFAIKNEDSKACDSLNSALAFYREARTKKPTDEIPAKSQYGGFEETIIGFLEELKCTSANMAGEAIGTRRAAPPSDTSL